MSIMAGIEKPILRLVSQEDDGFLPPVGSLAQNNVPRIHPLGETVMNPDGSDDRLSLGVAASAVTKPLEGRHLSLA